MWQKELDSYSQLHTMMFEIGDIYSKYGKIRKICSNLQKDDRPFLIGSNSINVCNSIDIFRYLFKREPSEILYNEFLVELKNHSDWFKKSKFKLYEAKEENIKLEVDNYWLDEIEARKFIRWFKENSTLR